MTAKDAIKELFKGNASIMDTYLADLSDADLLVRPVPAANHAAWQLGHLIWRQNGERLCPVGAVRQRQLLAEIVDINLELPDGERIRGSLAQQRIELSLFVGDLLVDGLLGVVAAGLDAQQVLHLGVSQLQVCLQLCVHRLEILFWRHRHNLPRQRHNGEEAGDGKEQHFHWTLRSLRRAS